MSGIKTDNQEILTQQRIFREIIDNTFLARLLSESTTWSRFAKASWGIRKYNKFMKKWRQ